MAVFDCGLMCSRQPGQQLEESYSSGKRKVFMNVGVFRVCMFSSFSWQRAGSQPSAVPA